MTTTVKRTFAVIVMVIVAMAMLLPAQAKEARADDFNDAKYKKKVTVYKDYVPVWLNMGSRDNGAKKITVTSSKSSVVKVNKYALADKMIIFDTKSKGKATLTIKIRKKSGTKTYKCKVKVVGYSTPVKSLKLAKHSFTKKCKKKNKYLNYTPKHKTEKVTVKCKRGWKVKIKHIWFTANSHSKSLKSGSKVTYRKNAEFECITYVFYNKSRNYTIIKQVNINR